MACENARQVFNNADEALTASIIQRNAADQDAAEAAAALESAQAANDAAVISAANAAAAVTSNAASADEAYTAYITCIQNGGPDAPPIATQLPS